MSLGGRVISGKYRHRPLAVLHDETTRTTKDRVKEGLFSALGESVTSKNILDLFAGSGGLGIEALSRGAASAIFVEKDGKTAEVLCKNLKFVSEETTVLTEDYRTALLKIAPNSVDIVFLDPPYERDMRAIVQDIYAANILKSEYILVLETEGECSLPSFNGILKKYKYGRTHLTIGRGTLWTISQFIQEVLIQLQTDILTS